MNIFKSTTPSYTGKQGVSTTDAAASSGMAFLVSQFELPQYKIIEPVGNVTFERDIQMNVGGGFAEYVSHLFASYADGAGNDLSIQAKANSDVSFIQANVTKDEFPLYNVQTAVRIGVLEMQYAEKLPFALQERFDKGVKLKWSLALNNNTYFGAANSGRVAYGIVNDPNVTTLSSPQTGTQNGTAAGTPASSQWVNKLPGQITAELNLLLSTAQAAVQYDSDALANHILLPFPDFNYIATTQYYGIGPNGTTNSNGQTILQYFLANNVATAAGADVVVYPIRQAIGAGVGGSNRAIAYCDKQEYLEMNITVPLRQIAMGMDFEKGTPSIVTAFAGQFGPPKKLLPQSFVYMDGI